MAQEICRPYGTLSRTPRRESEGGNPSAVLIGWGFGEGKNRNFPSPNAFFAHLSLRKERCKQFSSKRTQQDKSVHYGQNIFKLPRGKIPPTANGRRNAPPELLCFLSWFQERKIFRPLPSPAAKSSDHFSQKQLRSPRRFREERPLLSCCYDIVKNRAIFNRPCTHFPTRGRRLPFRPRKTGLPPAKLVTKRCRSSGKNLVFLREKKKTVEK